LKKQNFFEVMIRKFGQLLNHEYTAVKNLLLFGEQVSIAVFA